MMASFSAIITIFTFIISTINGERVYCDGSCSCGDGSATGETCILNCARTDSCKKSVLICSPDRPCIVECVGSASCADDVIINATQATDLSVICDGVDACKTGMNVYCGSGHCKLQCGDGTSCEKFGSVHANQALSFRCTNCPELIEPLQFTAYPTASPTMKPSIDPTLNPSSHPTVSPTNNPTRYPTNNPTIKPTKQPTNAPTLTVTPDPSVNPTIKTTNDPTFGPILKPTNYPTVLLTVHPTTRYITSNPTKEHSIQSIITSTGSVIKSMSTDTEEIMSDTESVDLDQILPVSKKKWNDYSDLILSICLLIVCGALIVLCRREASRRKKRDSEKEKKIEEHNLMQVIHGEKDGNNVTLPSPEGDDKDTRIQHGIVVHHDNYQFEYKLKAITDPTTNGYGMWDENTYENLRTAICMRFGLENDAFSMYELVNGDVIDIDDIDDIMSAFDSLLDGLHPRKLQIFVSANEGDDAEKTNLNKASPLYQGTAGEKASFDSNFSCGSNDISTIC